MTTEDEKMLAFGRMVFGIMTDVLVLPHGDMAYARKTITMPDGRGGKHRLDLLIARPTVADAMEECAAVQFGVYAIQASGGSKQ